MRESYEGSTLVEPGQGSAGLGGHKWVGVAPQMLTL